MNYHALWLWVLVAICFAFAGLIMAITIDYRSRKNGDSMSASEMVKRLGGFPNHTSSIVDPEKLQRPAPWAHSDDRPKPLDAEDRMPWAWESLLPRTNTSDTRRAYTVDIGGASVTLPENIGKQPSRGRTSTERSRDFAERWDKKVKLEARIIELADLVANMNFNVQEDSIRPMTNGAVDAMYDLKCAVDELRRLKL
jgi:hypothetical protein